MTGRKDFTEIVWRQIFERKEGRCSDCDRPHRYEDSGKTYHFDHIFPLWLALERDRHRFDIPENITVLCIDPCHRAKTAKEAGQRAKMKRLLKKAEAADARMAAKVSGKPPATMTRPAFAKGRKIPSRPFQKTPKRSRPERGDTPGHHLGPQQD